MDRSGENMEDTEDLRLSTDPQNEMKNHCWVCFCKTPDDGEEEVSLN